MRFLRDAVELQGKARHAGDRGRHGQGQGRGVEDAPTVLLGGVQQVGVRLPTRHETNGQHHHADGRVRRHSVEVTMPAEQKFGVNELGQQAGQGQEKDRQPGAAAVALQAPGHALYPLTEQAQPQQAKAQGGVGGHPAGLGVRVAPPGMQGRQVNAQIHAEQHLGQHGPGDAQQAGAQAGRPAPPPGTRAQRRPDQGQTTHRQTQAGAGHHGHEMLTPAEQHGGARDPTGHDQHPRHERENPTGGCKGKTAAGHGHGQGRTEEGEVWAHSNQMACPIKPGTRQQFTPCA